MLEKLVEQIGKLRVCIDAVDHAAEHHDADPFKHAKQIQKDLRPAMAELRKVADELETIVPANLWPLPTYRELLFIK
jgi:glutamine synthetase